MQPTEVIRNKEGKAILITFKHEGVCCIFNMYGIKLNMAKRSDANVYNQSNLWLPKDVYRQMVRIVYGIFNAKTVVKKSIVSVQLELDLKL